MITIEEIQAIDRAIQTVAFIEPCPRCARRERLALARLLRRSLPSDELRELLTTWPQTETPR